MNPLTIVSALAALGGIVGAILAVFKLSPERQSIFISTAQGAVIVQAGVIDDLREELVHLRKRIDDCELVEQQVDRLRGEIRSLQETIAGTRIERDTLQRENARLVARVALLETHVADLENGRRETGS